MSESGEKTEEATDTKLRDLRKKGQVPQRKNSTLAIYLVFGVLTLFALLPNVAPLLAEFMSIAISGTYQDWNATILALKEKGGEILLNFVIPFLVTCTFVVVFATLFLSQFLFSIENLKPKFEKLNPVQGFKNMISLDKFYELVINVVFLGFVFLLTYLTISENFENSINSIYCGYKCELAIFLSMAQKICYLILLYFIVVGGVDYVVQNVLFKRKQKMTKDEVKREHKQSEGDPAIKGKRKQIAREAIEGPSMKDITHAVASHTTVFAFQYDSKKRPVPTTVFKSRGEGAISVKRRLRSSGIKVVELPDIADKLYKQFQIGQQITQDYVEALQRVFEASER